MDNIKDVLINDVPIVAVRTIFAFVALFVISRITGERQISQLTFYDYIVGITIGSIAGMAVETNIPFLSIVVSMLFFGGLAVLISFLTNKSIIIRRWCTGKPIVMIYNGKIIKSSLKKHRYDINDLLLECRLKGYFDLSQIQCAVMEANGQMSILPKAEHRPITPSDTKMTIEQEYLQYNLIIDGRVMKHGLKKYGKDEKWLKTKLKEQNVGKISDVLLCVGDNNDKITVFLEDEQLPHDDFFM